ncbi:hypothetical protein AAHZ94_10805 [Streptomyces sp. HSW2009]|uniref:hypothetical protein n=1 Tax=Streptomyces sp. HSW2009 TaxID=3142890 RepID=UPI0032F066E6
MNRARIATTVAALSLTVGSLAAAAPSTSAASPSTDRAEVSITSVRGTVHGGHSIWKKVNPFRDKIGITFENDTVLATCKRWAADSKWWYWVRFDSDGTTGYISYDATNIRHSHLPKCS